MLIHFDGLTSYCVEGAWSMMELSPITYSLAKHTPFDYHGIDYDAISDDTSDMAMFATNDIAHQISRMAPDHHKKYIAKYMYWNLFDWLISLSSRVAGQLISSVVEGDDLSDRIYADFPVYKNISLLPTLSHELEALNPVVLDNALEGYTRGYMQEWIKDSANYLNMYHERCFDETGVDAEFEEANFRPTRVLPTCRRMRPVEKTVVKTSKKKLKSMRKAVTRARNLFNGISNGKQIVNSFIAGDSVDIEGNVFDYTIRKTYDLMYENGGYFQSIPYKLNVVDKGTGLVLGSLCVYFEETPILDQVFGLLLYINSGIEFEEKILNKANVLSLTEEGKRSELLKSYNTDCYLFQEGCPIERGVGRRKVLTPQQINVRALIAVYIFNRLIEVSGIEYPKENLNGARKHLIDKSTLPMKAAKISDTNAVLSIGKTYV